MGAHVVCACVSSPSAARRRRGRKRQMFWVQGLVSLQSYRTGDRVEWCRAAPAQWAPVRLLHQQQARVQEETSGISKGDGKVRSTAGRRQGCEDKSMACQGATRVLASSLFAAMPRQTLQEEAFGSRSGLRSPPGASRSLQESGALGAPCLTWPRRLTSVALCAFPGLWQHYCLCQCRCLVDVKMVHAQASPLYIHSDARETA